MRNGNIDPLRLVAAIGIVSLHVGDYAAEPPALTDFIQTAFRWCVPFFFVVTGYFLADPTRPFPRVQTSRLALPFRLFAIASAVFAPIYLIQHGLGLNLEILVRGTYLHLWYLTGLIIALLTLDTLGTFKSLAPAFIASIAIAASFALASYFYAFTGKQYGAVMLIRELSGVPAIFLGGLIRVRGIGAKTAAVVFLGALTLQAAEALGVRFAGHSASDLQFSFATLPLAVGILGLAITSRDLAPKWVSQLGQRESLGIYLYHPLAVVGIATLFTHQIRTAPQGAPGVATWLLSAAVTIAGLLALRRFAPSLRELLDGRLSDQGAGAGNQSDGASLMKTPD